jgi:isopenicillin N synthase-like dioxygenase
MTFKKLPVIDLSLDKPDTKAILLAQLKDALFRVGFLYLINHGVDSEADRIMEIAPKAFEIPFDEKLKVAMTKNPHFVGYTQLGAETTAKATDIREQYDFGSATEPNTETEPQWKRLKGPSLYIRDEVLRGFKTAVTDYISRMEKLASRLLELIAESLNLPAETFKPFEGEMNRLKLVKYPPVEGDASRQGVGPHKDSSGMLTFVLQDDVGGLQVLNSEGEWISADPIRGSFVVNIAQGFEALTGGRCGATTHRVVSPSGLTRYSIPYFHSVRLNLTMNDIREQLDFIQGRIPEPSDEKKRQVDVPSEFLDPKYSCFGEAHLRNRIVSHKDVAAIWYADIKDKYIMES